MENIEDDQFRENCKTQAPITEVNKITTTYASNSECHELDNEEVLNTFVNTNKFGQGGFLVADVKESTIFNGNVWDITNKLKLLDQGDMRVLYENETIIDKAYPSS